MKKFIAACIVLLVSACASVQDSTSKLELATREISIVSVCESELAAKTIYDAARKEDEKKYSIPFQLGQCHQLHSKVKVKLVRFLEKGKDWEGDEYHLVEVESLSTGTRGFSPYWPLHDKPEGHKI